MARRPLLAGNWKIDMTVAQALEWVDSSLPDLEALESVGGASLIPESFTAIASAAAS